MARRVVVVLVAVAFGMDRSRRCVAAGFGIGLGAIARTSGETASFCRSTIRTRGTDRGGHLGSGALGVRSGLVVTHSKERALSTGVDR